MPPIIEDYAAIKRRMDEMANPTRGLTLAELITMLENNLAGFVCTLAEQQDAADKSFQALEARSILTDEGRALIEKHKGDL
jgi:hypothetical protein